MGRTYVVTGANRGLGRTLMERLKARGDTVIGTDRALLDVTDPASVERFAHILDGRPVDVLVNNAGRQYRASRLEDLDFDEVRDTFEVNTFGPLRVLRALLPNLRAGAGRQVVHVTSRMGSHGAFGANMYAYRASKAALNVFHRCLAEEFAPEGFVCVALHPGWVRTDMGGPDATLDAATSVAGMLEVMDGLGPAHNGGLFDHTGATLPW